MIINTALVLAEILEDAMVNWTESENFWQIISLKMLSLLLWFTIIVDLDVGMCGLSTHRNETFENYTVPNTTSMEPLIKARESTGPRKDIGWMLLIISIIATIIVVISVMVNKRIEQRNKQRIEWLVERSRSGDLDECHSSAYSSFAE